MVTQAELNDLLSQANEFFTPTDRAELERELLTVLINGLPDWDSATDSILRRALPLIAEQVEVWITTNEENIKQGLLAYAEGPLLDIFGLGPPLVRRRLGEEDDPYRLRIANASNRLNLGSLAGYEEAAREQDTTLADALAVVSPNRQNVRIFVALPDAGIPTPEAIADLRTFFGGRGASIAGADVDVSAPTVREYRINVTARYDPAVHSEDTVRNSVRDSIYQFIRDSRRIGQKIYLSRLRDAAFTPECVDVAAAFALIENPGTPAARRSTVNGNLYTNDPTYQLTRMHTCPLTLASSAADIAGGLWLEVTAI